MGSQFVDGGPGWGSVFSNAISGIESAPGKALDNIAKAEAIKDARTKRAREEEFYGLTKNLLGTVEGAVPQAQAKPTTTYGPFTGDPNEPGVIQGLPTATFVDPRMQAAAESRRLSAVAGTKATLFKDPSQWAPQLAQSEVASTGVPERADERARIQFASTGKFPTAEETKTPNAQNFAVVNADGTATGQGYASLDGGKTAIGGGKITLEPGQRVMETGPAPLQVGNPLENTAKALERLNVLRREINPETGPTPEQALQVQQLVDVAYKPTRVVEKVGDQNVVKYVQQNPIPPWVAAMLGGTQPPPAPVATVTPPPPPTTIASQAITARDISDPARLDAPLPPAPTAPAAAAVQPIVDPNAERIVAVQPGSAIELRKEVMQQPAIKEYAAAIPNYNTMVKAAQGDVENGLLPTSSSDLNIIYAIAKLFDPGSVVREGELKLAQGTAPIADMLQAAWSKAITGDGMMTPEMRANLIAEGMKRMEQYRVGKNLVQNQYTNIAKKTGVDPELAIPQMPDMLPYDRNAILNPTIGRAAPRPPTAPARTQPSQRSTAPPPIIQRGDAIFGE